MKSKRMLILFVTLIEVALCRAEQKSLYSSSDHVISLDTSNFNQTIFSTFPNTTFMVQFYNYYCPHCQAFSPIYKELASRVANWTDSFVLAAIDCSKTENLPTCIDNNILAFPTIYTFPPNSVYKSRHIKNLWESKIEWTVDDIEEYIVDFMTNLTEIETNFKIPIIVKALQPLKIDSPVLIDRLYQGNYKDIKTDILLIIESGKSYVGRKLILEFYRLRQQLEIRRVLSSNTHLLKNLLPQHVIDNFNDSRCIVVKLQGSTKAVVFDATLPSKETLIDGVSQADSFYKLFIDFIYSSYPDFTSQQSTHNYFKGIQVDSDNKKLHEDEIEFLHQVDKKIADKVFSVDILKAVTFIIVHEIRTKGDLTGEHICTLRNLLSIFTKYLPLKLWDPLLFNFISSMRTNIDLNRTEYDAKGMDRHRYAQLIEVLGGNIRLSSYNGKSYLSCFLSNKNQKGYTCSLWLLFHVLTMSEYKASSISSSPRLVITTMRDYIVNFLGCSECAQNFKQETEDMELGLKTRSSAVIWLWRVHNKVRLRLSMKSNHIRPLTHVVFPSVIACEKCYDDFNSSNLDMLRWNNQEVLSFLESIYSVSNIIDPIQTDKIMKKTRQQIQANKSDTYIDSSIKPEALILNSSLHDEHSKQSIFSTSDIGLCLVLYIVCILLVGAVFLALNPRYVRFKIRSVLARNSF